MQVRCPSCLVATHVQAVFRSHGVTMIQLIGPFLGDPGITIMVHQNLSVTKEPAIRRQLHGISGTTIMG
jgi:hypothetical protein